MNNKICLITGANSGIGKITALEIAKLGATVIMVCRNKKKGEEALAEIISQSKSDKVELMICDIESQKSVRKFVEEFKAKYKKLDVLINNAGIILSEKSVSEDGIESMYAINHFGGFLLTNLLLDTIKASDSGRIINVSSEGHRIGHIKFNDINSDKSFNGLRVYCDTKLANVLFTKELSRRLEGSKVTVNCLHPGVVRTNFSMDSTGLFTVLVKMFRPFLISPEKGAATQIYLATSPQVQGITGEYFNKKKPVKSSGESRNPEVAKKLWELSEKMTGLR